MAHDHDHGHEENYFLDQISTVTVCVVLGVIGFMVWKFNILIDLNILTEKFNRLVLVGSIALLVVSVIRGISLWAEVSRRKVLAPARGHSHSHGHRHQHDHDHGDHHHHDHDHGDHHHHHDHNHDHDHKNACDHDHGPGEKCDHEHSHDHAHSHNADHGHDHGFAPWRYAVLVMPLMLSGLLLYYHFNGIVLTYSTDRLEGMAGNNDVLDAPGGVVASKEDKLYTPGLKELGDAATKPDVRTWWTGRNAELRGLFAPVTDKEFALFRLKMTCCASDAVPVKVRIFAKDAQALSGLQRAKGVTVTGQIQFAKVKDKDEYAPIMIATQIVPTELGNDIYDRDR